MASVKDKGYSPRDIVNSRVLDHLTAQG